jgi:hypothetical protein
MSCDSWLKSYDYALKYEKILRDCLHGDLDALVPFGKLQVENWVKPKMAKSGWERRMTRLS